jgi:hypothetical protein
MNIRPALRNALLASSLFCCAFPLHADEASKRAKAGDLLTVLHIDQNLNSLLNQQSAQIQKGIANMSSQGKLTPPQQKDTDVFMQKVVGMVRDGISWQKVKPQFVELYASTYSEQDLDGLLSFYRSPLGQKLLQNQPELASKSQLIIQQHMQEVQPKLRDAFDQFKKEMQVKYPNLSSK